ncbi:putative ankyrin repeat protein RF_0381 isoform X2 [Oscarella lobularis]|uniref:putative ankyrin repeat protein RF_0381 isoform X2 n=1 Tax=Oscarella lobularis TaxID=121494 RepID=UPI003313E795
MERRTSIALHCACLYGRIEEVKYLINDPARINAIDENGWTPFMFACQEGHLVIAQMLVYENCSVHIKSKIGWTALHIASFNGQTAICEYLIDHCGVNVNEQDEKGSTSLMKACDRGYLDTVQLLGSKKCDFNIRNQDGCAALHFASCNGHTAICKYLIDRCGVDVNEEENIDGMTPLMGACGHGHLSTVKLLVSKNCNFNAKNKNGWTALHCASSFGQTAICEFLIDRCRVDVDEQDNKGSTSLMKACDRGYLDTVQLLGSKKCDFNIRNQDGCAALHFASCNGHTAICEYLIDQQYGVDVNEDENIDGMTPLMGACGHGHLSTVELLVSKKCNFNAKNKNGWTALHCASSFGQTAICEFLIDRCRVDVDEQDNNASTSLMMACERGHLSTVQLLASKNCDFHIKNKFGKTALYLACSYSQIDVADFLIRRNLTYAQQHSEFLLALRNCRFSIAEELKSIEFFNKMTVIHDVLSGIRQIRKDCFSEPQTLLLFLACGASASAKNEYDKLPYECASGESRHILKCAWLESQYAELSVMGYSSPSRIKAHLPDA